MISTYTCATFLLTSLCIFFQFSFRIKCDPFIAVYTTGLGPSPFHVLYPLSYALYPFFLFFQPSFSCFHNFECFFTFHSSSLYFSLLFLSSFFLFSSSIFFYFHFFLYPLSYLSPLIIFFHLDALHLDVYVDARFLAPMICLFISSSSNSMTPLKHKPKQQ